VGVDGWISLVQRQDNYNGHKFTYEWADGKVGGKLLAATCLIARKDLGAPIEHTEFMEECYRDTEPWKKWPRRMLTHKVFIQCARYAFGFGGVYDQDEAERIIEAELRPAEGGGFRTEIQMPQRQQTISSGQAAAVVQDAVNVTNSAESVAVEETAAVLNDVFPSNEESVPDDGKPKDYGFGAPPLGASTEAAEQPAEDLFAAKVELAPAHEQAVKRSIGKGKAGRIRAICTTKKTRTDADFDELKQAWNIEHLEDFPESRYKDLENWAEGK